VAKGGRTEMEGEYGIKKGDVGYLKRE